MKWWTAVFLVFWLSLALSGFAQVNSQRKASVSRYLDSLEQGQTPAPQPPPRRLPPPRPVYKPPAAKPQPRPYSQQGFGTQLYSFVADNEGYWDLWLQQGYLTGDTTYTINVPEIRSELKFPLGNYLLGLTANISAKNSENKKHDRFRFSCTGLGITKGAAGTLEDSDWLGDTYDLVYTGSTHSGLDIYSESDAELNGYLGDLRLVVNCFSWGDIFVGPLVGWRYEKFDYSVNNATQTGYGSYAAAYTGTISGPVLDYEVEYSLPYAGLNMDLFAGDSLSLQLAGGYCFNAKAEDRDDHLVRYKLSRGDCEGDGYIADITLRWDFLPNWSLAANFEYLDIETTGQQRQEFYSGPLVGTTIDNIDDKISSSQLLFSGAFSYRF